MNNWQGYADLNGLPGDVRVTLGRFGQERAEILEFGPVSVRSLVVEEGVAHESAQPLTMHVDIAEALYKALDRVFGNHHEQGAIDATRAALAKEQARVDHVLSVLLPRPILPPGESLARPQSVPGSGPADS